MEGAARSLPGSEEGLTSLLQHVLPAGAGGGDESGHEAAPQDPMAAFYAAFPDPSMTSHNVDRSEPDPAAMDMDFDLDDLNQMFGPTPFTAEAETGAPYSPPTHPVTVQTTARPDVSGSTGKHVCDVCEKGFGRAWDLKRHMRLHTNTRAFACEHPGCSRTFVQRSALTVHVRVHTGERPHACTFAGCTRAFGDSSALARHRRLHDADPFPFKCPWADGTCCGQFLRKDALIGHMKTHDPTWVAPPDFARNWVSNALPKKPAKRKRRRRDESSDEEEDGDPTAALPTLFARAVEPQTGRRLRASTNPHPSQQPTAALSRTLGDALAHVPVQAESSGTRRAGSAGLSEEETDGEVAKLLAETLGDDDEDGLLSVELRPRGAR